MLFENIRYGDAEFDRQQFVAGGVGAGGAVFYKVFKIVVDVVLLLTEVDGAEASVTLYLSLIHI